MKSRKAKENGRLVFPGLPIHGFRVQNHWVSSKVVSIFYPSKSIRWEPRIFGDFVVESKLLPPSGSVALKQLNPIHKKGP